MDSIFLFTQMSYRCGNVAAILELDENLNKEFRVFEAAPQVGALINASMGLVFCLCYHLLSFSLLSHALNNNGKMQEARGAPARKPPPDYFL